MRRADAHPQQTGYFAMESRVLHWCRPFFVTWQEPQWPWWAAEFMLPNGDGNPGLFHCGNARAAHGGLSIPFCLFTGGYRIVIPEKIEKQFLTVLDTLRFEWLQLPGRPGLSETSGATGKFKK